MKRLFLCEFITCGGMRDRDLPKALLADAEIMYQVLLADLQDIDDIEIISCRDSRLPFVNASVVEINTGDNVWKQWKRCMDNADLAWIIAPETDGVLLRLNRLARQCCGKLIGSDDDAVELTASKQDTNEYLLAHGMPTLTSRRLDDELLHSDSGWIIKPNDGAGSEGCYFFDNPAEVRRWKRRVENAGKYIQQRYLPGTPISMSVLYARKRARLLSVNRQKVSISQARLVNNGTPVHVSGKCQSQLESLAREIGKLIPGLHAYVGIDLVLTDSGPVIIEINPRLTTSYAGLSKLLNLNAAELILDSQCQSDRETFRGNDHRATGGLQLESL